MRLHISLINFLLVFTIIGVFSKLDYQLYLLPQVENTCGLMTNKSGDGFKQMTLPLHFLVDESMPKERYADILEAAKMFNETMKFEVIRIVGYGDHRKLVQSRIASITYIRDNWSPTFSPQATMMTLFRDVGRTMMGVQIVVNSHYYDNASKDYFIRVMRHEFAHALGLPHVDDEDDLMYYSSSEGKVVNYETTFTKLECAYGEYRNNPRRTKLIQSP